MISILIPAKKEKYLGRTMKNILTQARGEIEIIAVLDGYWPDDMPISDRRVAIIHHVESIGQREAINEAACIASGDFLLKCDAHCAFDEGFDVKLAEHCEEDWVVIPRQYQLDEDTWQPKWKKKTDFMYFNSPYAKEQPMRIQYYDKKMYRQFPEHYKQYKKAPWRQGAICDTMASLGAVWFMRNDYFFKLGGMDTQHSHWGQMGVEIACKAWLSGGRQVVNKNTWFAHLWRRTPPWKLTQEEVEQSREHSIKFWTEGKWALQKYPLQWLADKFGPVPTWNGHKPKVKSDLTILYYTANEVKFDVTKDLKRIAGDSPIISISQEPFDFGENICVGKIGRSLQNIYMAVLAGARKAKTKYVALCEDDCYYNQEHLSYRPPEDKFAYNLNRWLLHTEKEPIFSYRRRPILSQCIAPRKLLIECLEQREGRDIPKEFCGEMGLFEKQLGLKEYQYETFETKEPTLVVCHRKNTSGRKLIGKDAEPREHLEPWGNAKEIVKALLPGNEIMEKQLIPNRKYKVDTPEFNQICEDADAMIERTEDEDAKKINDPGDQHTYVKGKVFNIDELIKHIVTFRDRRRPRLRAVRRLLSQPPFIRKVLDGVEFTDEQLTKQTYYDCIRYTQKTGHSKAIRLMRDMIRLVHDVKAHGMKAPLDMWREKDKLVIHRGWRRLMIINELHRRKIQDHSKVPARVFKDIHVFRKYNPSPKWAEGPVKWDSIHGLAQQQFCDMGHHSTDKYWVHGYTPLYDRHIGHMKDDKIKLLELGVLRGASLLLWRAAFTKGAIYGVDKNTRVWQEFLKGKDRIKVFVGRQEDREFMKSQVVSSGPYDIIIDDASHAPDFQLMMFKNLWPSLSPKGVYVIEDMHGNYWSRRAKNGPMMIDKIKSVMDDMMNPENKIMDAASISCYYNICFIEKL